MKKKMTASQKKLIFKIFKAVAVPNIVTNKVICASSMIFYLYAFVPTHLRSQFMHRCVAPVSVRTLLCKEYCTYVFPVKYYLWSELALRATFIQIALTRPKRSCTCVGGTPTFPARDQP